jgi:hypothetical protein
MINYTSWPITLSNMKAIGPMTLEELHWQSEAGQTNGKTICPQTIALEDNWYVWFNDEWWCHLSDCYVQRWMIVSFEWLLCSTMNDDVIWVIVMFNDEWWCHLSDCYVQRWMMVSFEWLLCSMMVSFEWLLCSMMNDGVIWVIVMFNDEWWCHLSDCYVQWWCHLNDCYVQWWCHLSDCYLTASKQIFSYIMAEQVKISMRWVNEFLLFNVNSAIFQLYHGGTS